MWQDPIVAETRALREAYAAEFGHDPNAIFDDILKRQAQSGEKLYRFTPRKIRTDPEKQEEPARVGRNAIAVPPPR